MKLMCWICLLNFYLWAKQSSISVESSAVGVVMNLSAQGYVDQANVTALVQNAIECAVLCSRMRICSMFSVTSQGNTTDLVCKVASGFSSWTRDSSSGLYMEYDKSIQDSGYTLQPDGKFYKYFYELIPFAASHRACYDDKATVASPHPLLSKNIILNYTTPYPYYYYAIPAGAYRITDSTNGTWVTYDGQFFNTHIPDGVQTWFETEPSGYSNEQCLVIGFGNPGMLNDVECDVMPGFTYPRLCTRTVGYNLASNGKYYKVLHINGTSHAGAEQLCKEDGAQLAIAPYGPVNIQAMYAFMAQLSGLTSGPKEAFLVDGTDAAAEGLWSLPNGVTIDSSQRLTDAGQIWESGQPNGSTTENCLGLASGGLVDLSCNGGGNGKILCELTLP